MVDERLPGILAKNDLPNLTSLKENYDIANHPVLLVQALRRCQVDNSPPPDWVVEELERMVTPLVDKRPGRGKRSPDEIAMQYVVDRMRAIMVDLVRQKQGVPARESFQAAADEIASLDEWSRWRGSEEAIRQSYKRDRKRRLDELRKRQKAREG